MFAAAVVYTCEYKKFLFAAEMFTFICAQQETSAMSHLPQ